MKITKKNYLLCNSKFFFNLRDRLRNSEELPNLNMKSLIKMMKSYINMIEKQSKTFSKKSKSYIFIKSALPILKSIKLN
jgi:hypothetical protein